MLRDLKEAVRVHGAGQVGCTLLEAIQKDKINLDTISLRRLFEAFVGPVEECLAYPQKRRGFVDMGVLRMAGVSERELREAAVGTSVFGVITGQLIAKRVIAGYNEVATIGRQLVDVMQSTHKEERFAGFNAFGGFEEVAEGEDYPETGFGEKYVTTTALKKGLIIKLTEEAIMEDQTGQLLRRASDIGRVARRDEEETILLAITEPAAAYYSWRPSGSAATLYSTTLHTLKESNGLVDWNNIDAAEQELAEIVDEASKSIPSLADTILIPMALNKVAQYIVNATQVNYGIDKGGGSEGATARVLTANTVSAYKIVTSPLVHQVQVAAGVSASVAKSSWWHGNFKAQFMLREIWPIQVFHRSGQQTEDGWKKDVVEQFKVRAYSGVNALDYVHVIKNTA